ncbi:MAG: gliding motility-related protein [Fluviicola sp.]|nr:gliding motility-related protein [Fluviicola sp.]
MLMMLISVFGMSTTNLKAQTLFSPNTYSGWVSTPTNSFATIPSAPGVTFTQITRGSGNTFSTAADGINSSKWNNPSANAAVTANQYLTFSVSATSTATAEIDSLVLILGRSASGPDSCILQYKSAGTGNVFTSVVSGVRVIQHPTNSPTTILSFIPPAPISVAAGDTVVFRLVAWHAASTLGTMKLINNSAVYGKAISVTTNSITAPVVQSNNATCVSSLLSDSVQVTFNSAGVFNAGNSYSLELSDASGDFSAPLILGTLNSNSNTGTINGFIPAGTASANYLLRIKSSDPVINGLDTTHLLVYPGMALGASVIQPDCPDSTGEIDLTITGGSGLIQYSWSNGELTQDLNNLDGGTYEVNLSDAVGCSADSSFSIQSVSAFLVTDSLAHILCNSGSEGSIHVSVSGGTAPYSISWTGNGISQTGPAALNLSAGDYDLVVLDAHNCIYNADYTLTEPLPLSVSASVVNAVCSTCNGTITLSTQGGVAPYSFLWEDNTTSPVMTAVPGEYCLEVSDANACELDTCFTISSTAGIADEDSNSLIRIFPNPASDMFQVLFSQQLLGVKKEVLVLNSLGEVVFEETLDSNMQQLIIKADQWHSGTYTYQINSENGFVEIGKIMIIQ